jgi:Prenyltransferase and squalene oxidase repeat
MNPDSSNHRTGGSAVAGVHARPARACRGWWSLALGLVCLAAVGPLAGGAAAAGNASAAAGFIENAQNKDGGFGAQRGQGSDAGASLWATVALLAAGRNPRDERLNNGVSADDYVAAHLSAYTSLSNLGLLAIAQSAAGVGAQRYGDPGSALVGGLSTSAVRHDPGGAALGALGLLAINSGNTRAAADAAARVLLANPASDGGWGSGESDSASTALVLQALAESGVADAGNPTVSRGIAYLKRAQVNDGSIAASDRTDPSSTGNVAATAFTIQALRALRIAALRTSTGTSVLEGLTSYQQQGTGGLSQFGSYDTQVSPSVIDTAQAYPAFDGVTFPLASVPSTGPPPIKHAAPQAAPRSSAGSASTGISSSTSSGAKTVGAYRGASAVGAVRSSSGRGAAAASGTSVTGAVVGATPAPKLTTRSGRNPTKDHTALILTAALVAFALLGGSLDARRPRRDPRSRVVVIVGAVAGLLSAARARGAAAPVAALALGATLVAVPFATGIWGNAPRGAAMIDAFAPYMRAQRLEALQRDVAELDAGVKEASLKGPGLQFPHLRTGALAQKQFAAADPELALFSKQWPPTHARLLRVLDPVQANRANYDAIAALPSFASMSWFFLAPGAILILLAAVALVLPNTWAKLRWVMLALGVGLAVAPLALQMFDRTAKGDRLIASFRTVETQATLAAIQNDFGSLALGQGALRTELLPGLAQRGMSQVQIRGALPAVSTLDSRWVAILGDLTPMLGVLSDNISRYQAVLALPDFTLFPWLFVIPGLLAVGPVLLPGARSQLVVRRRLQAAEAQAT